MPKKQTYEVIVTADAVRTIKVRAEGGAEAFDIAKSRIAERSGPWTIDFPGADDEHYTVTRVADDHIVGPDSQGDFDDEEETEEAGES